MFSKYAVFFIDDNDDDNDDYKKISRQSKQILASKIERERVRVRNFKIFNKVLTQKNIVYKIVKQTNKQTNKMCNKWFKLFDFKNLLQYRLNSLFIIN